MKLKVAQLCPTLCDPMGYTLPGILQARILEWVAFPCSRGSSQPKDRTHVSRIAGDSLPAKPQGKPKTTGVGNLSLLQQIFSTQELNRGLLNCRQILYQLSSQGTPGEIKCTINAICLNHPETIPPHTPVRGKIIFHEIDP